MKKSICLLLGLLFVIGQIKANDTFTVLQMNLWHGGTKVPGGYQGIVDVLEQIDADVVFLCEIRDGNKFIANAIRDLKSKGKIYYGETLDMDIGILSKFKPDSIRKCCFDMDKNFRPMLKMIATVNGQPISFYSCHLDYTHYECYMPRGYSGTTWKKIDSPITDESIVLEG